MTALSTSEIVDALRRGPATLDALAARLGGGGHDVDREAIHWAVDEAIGQGVVVSSAPWSDCGPDGLCGTSAPTVLSLAAR